MNESSLATLRGYAASTGASGLRDLITAALVEVDAIESKLIEAETQRDRNMEIIDWNRGQHGREIERLRAISDAHLERVEAAQTILTEAGRRAHSMRQLGRKTARLADLFEGES